MVDDEVPTQMNPYEMAKVQLRHVAKRMKLDPNIHEVLKHPMRSLEVFLPVRMDNGTIRVFTGYRVQHSMARGPAKGGVRFHQNVTEDEVKELRQLSKGLKVETEQVDACLKLAEKLAGGGETADELSKLHELGVPREALAMACGLDEGTL